MKKQSFIHGAAVLAIASILCKIMSAAFKIPLDRLFLHEDGIGVYQSAYSVYNVFLAICVTGIPVALSSLIASSKNEEEAQGYAQSTFVYVSLFSLVASLALFVFAQPLARVLSGGGSPVARYSLKALSPALLVMGIISSRRGFFQGKGLMTPSAVSQLAESGAKVVLGIGICALTYKKGIEAGSAGAIAGVTIGAFFSAIVLEASFRKLKAQRVGADLGKALKVLKLSVPMTLGAFAFTAVMLTDTLMVPKLLATSGIGQAERLKLFGYLTRANTVYNLPATIITAFTASAVPAIAAVKGSAEKLSENCARAIKLVLLAAFPSGIGMAIFSGDILSLLYNSSQHYTILALCGAMVIIMPFIQTTTAMLQTLGKVWEPIGVTIGAVLIKIILNFVFVPMAGVEGAPLSTVIAFLPAAVINYILVSNKVSLKGTFVVGVKLFATALAACVGGWLIYMVRPGVKLFLVAMAFAAIIYGIVVVLSGTITKDEISGKG